MYMRIVSFFKSLFRNKKSFQNNADDFDWDAYEEAVAEDPLSPVYECEKLLEELSEVNIIGLYERIDAFIFQDINFGKVISIMPKWVCDDGISPEGCCSKEFYEKLRSKATHPVFNMFIYYYDLWSLVAAIQDRISAVIFYMQELYKLVPCKMKYKSEQYTTGSRHGGKRETQAHILLNSIFVSFTSIFDILSKIAIEQFMFDQYDFTKYKDMHCKKENAMYKPNIKNIDPSLKQNGLLFTDPEVIRKFETFRNEYVHNGPWDLRSVVYYTAVNGEPADVIIYSPDMIDGHFVTSNSRNKFYSQDNRINEQLPNMINEATRILMRTIDQISALYQQNTVRSENPKLTEEYMKAIADYYKSLN